MNQKNKIATLILGIITAVVVVFSQLFWFQGQSLSKDFSKTEQTAEADQEQESPGTYITQLSSPATTSNTIVVEQEFSFIEEFGNRVKEVKKELSNTLIVRAGKFFETLFSAIISPNAP